MKKIVVATNNKGKLKEIKNILTEYEIISLKDIECNIEVEEDGKTFEENSIKKAMEISKKINMPCIADDSGLCIEIFEGWPGVLTARFLGENSTSSNRNEYILNKMKDTRIGERSAKFKCCISYYYNGKVVTTEGILNGKISNKARGENGFGFDEIFELENGKTLAELTDNEKEKINPRKIALEKLKKLI